MSCYFYCLLDLSYGECNVISLYFLCFSVNGSICLVCCVSDSVCEVFGGTICDFFGGGVWLLVCCWMLWKY